MTAPHHRWSCFTLRTLFVVVTEAGAIVGFIRAFPQLALFLAFVLGVFIVWAGLVVLIAVLLQAVVSAVARRISLLFGLEELPTAKVDRL